MPKKEWTEDERKAFGQKMRAARQEKIEQEVQEESNVDIETQDVKGAEPDQDRVAKLEAQIELLLKLQGAQVPQNQNAPVTTKTPYSLDLEVYENPTKNLMDWAAKDRRMQQQAFTANFELQFVREVPARYQLADGSWQQVPKFTLGLLELAYDDDGNVLTRRNEKGEEVQIKYLRKRLVMFEDPDYALAVAYNKGLTLDDRTSQRFLNDMRFLQAQDWLLEVFYPPKSTTQPGLREEAIAGQMVTIVETPTKWAEVDQDHKLRV